MRTYSEAKIRDASRGRLFQNTVQGQPAWSNGSILEIGCDNPFKKLKNIVWLKSPPCFDTVVLRASQNERVPVLSGPHADRDVDLAVLKAGKSVCCIQRNYYNFFAARYKDCRFEIPVTLGEAVCVFAGEKLVGLIMPLERKEK